MSNSNKVKLTLEWRREDGQSRAVWRLHDGKEGRPVYMLYLLLEYYKKRGFLNKENSYKILQYLSEKDGLNLVSPGQLLFYGGFLDTTQLKITKGNGDQNGKN